MNLTERAQRYLQKIYRDPEWTTLEEETRDYLKILNSPYTDVLLNTQLHYGGYQLKIGPNNKEVSKLQFLSKTHLKTCRKIYRERMNATTLFKFDNGQTPQLYYISSEGILYTMNHEQSGVYHVSYERIETCIEFYALLNAYYYMSEFRSSNYDVRDFERLKKALSSFELVPECSDCYNVCYKSNQVIIKAGPWLEAEGYFVTLYGINDPAWQSVLAMLEKEGIV